MHLSALPSACVFEGIVNQVICLSQTLLIK